MSCYVQFYKVDFFFLSAQFVNKPNGHKITDPEDVSSGACLVLFFPLGIGQL